MSKAEKVIKAALSEAVREAVKQSPVPASPFETESIVREAITEAAPVIVHATNNEPWYQSRVTWGAIGAIVIPLLGFAGVTSDIITMDEFVAGGMALGGIASGALTLYGRWKARKPLGQ